MNPGTVGAALAAVRALGVDRLDAQLLMAFVLAKPRTWVLAHGDAALDIGHSQRWCALSESRAAGVPLAYLTGTKEFRGLMLGVDGNVLIPRPETEVLVERALALLPSLDGDSSAPRCVDLGTGSGAIALAVKSAHPACRMHASDSSEAALAVARRNAARLGVDIDFRAGSWWTPWQGERFDLVLANPPYIATGDPHLAALTHEPAQALVGGIDGLVALRAIVAEARDHLATGGWLWLEHGYDQAEAVRAMLRAGALGSVETLTDLSGIPRCSGGRLL